MGSGHRGVYGGEGPASHGGTGRVRGVAVCGRGGPFGERGVGGGGRGMGGPQGCVGTQGVGEGGRTNQDRGCGFGGGQEMAPSVCSRRVRGVRGRRCGDARSSTPRYGGGTTRSEPSGVRSSGGVRRGAGGCRARSSGGECGAASVVDGACEARHSLGGAQAGAGDVTGGCTCGIRGVGPSAPSSGMSARRRLRRVVRRRPAADVRCPRTVPSHIVSVAPNMTSARAIYSRGVESVSLLVRGAPTSAPSKRIRAIVPEYHKTVDGIVAAERIGLETIRAACPHFNHWLTRVERAPGLVSAGPQVE